MSKRIVSLLMIGLLAGTAAHAQSTGGHGRGGGRRGGSPGGSAPAPTAGSAPTQRATPVNEIEIIGVVKAIAPDTDRVTIAYDAVDALGWPPGMMPFVVSKSALLKDVTVGEKVRFKLDSEQISVLNPF
jgi:Cu/Ag efflux protein CusF